MGRGRSSETLVRTGEVSPVVSRNIERPPAGDHTRAGLCGSRFLSPADFKTALADHAQAEGFDAFGVTKPDAIPEAEARLRSWIEAGFHGSMTWMEERVDERAAPSTLWSEVKSIVMLGFSYAPDHNVLEDIAKKDRGVISAYAQSRDYHDVIKTKLKHLARFMVETKAKQKSSSKSECEPAVKVFVDTAPVMEKALAHAAGLGWQGKHTVLVSRAQGSWMFLGAIYANFEIPIDEKEHNHCGTCTRCLSICPTDAFPAPYQLDSNKCIC